VLAFVLVLVLALDEAEVEVEAEAEDSCSSDGSEEEEEVGDDEKNRVFEHDACNNRLQFNDDDDDDDDDLRCICTRSRNRRPHRIGSIILIVRLAWWKAPMKNHSATQRLY
jgi:hypothetical protein